MQIWKTLCLIPFFLFSLIVEAPHFRDLEQYADSDTLVLLDIDDTLLITSQMLGSDVWFCERLHYNQSCISSFRDALDHTLGDFRHRKGALDHLALDR